MLFIIKTLKIKREQIISLNITPINIPKYPKPVKLAAIGSSVTTENNPAFSNTFLAN